MKEFFKSCKYPFILITLVNFILSPWWESLLHAPAALITVINFSLLTLASFNASKENGIRIFITIIGLSAMLISWFEYAHIGEYSLSIFRMLLYLIMFSFLLFVLVRNVNRADKVGIEIIVGMMSGFILIGILGGVIFEIIDYYNPQSLSFMVENGSYKFYYFSFINLTSVGFGDIAPLTSQAQATAVIIGLLGQFYLAFGVSVFIGKYLSHQGQDK